MQINNVTNYVYKIYKGDYKDMEKLIVLGTGNAMATKCYNTCFAITNGEEYFLVDAGGGNGILSVLDKSNIDLFRIRNMFVTHGHSDHILGVIWVIRKIGTMILNNKYHGEFNIYCHDDLGNAIITISKLTLQQKVTDLFGKRIVIHSVKDGEKKKIMDYNITFFDIHSTKAKQFGFTMKLRNEKILTCMGDEPYNSLCESFIRNSNWLLSEAFCLYEDREKFKPYEKHHSTVKDAAELAEKLNIENLVLWHTEDSKINHRNALYTNEGRKYYSGNLFVPNDLDTIEL